MRARFLNDREKQGTRAFYESAFPEDSEEFVDFYYKWIVGRNDIFAVGEWEGDRAMVQAMVHINSHCLSINGSRRNIPYLVAVATRPDCRRQGKMRYLLENALMDMHRRQYAFAFLMPANPAYYTGLGFRYFPCQPAGKEGAFGGSFPGMSWRNAETGDIGRMCAFANQVLGQEYQISVYWDDAYCRRLFAEAAAGQGGVMLLESQDGLQGILVYGVSPEGEGKGSAEIKDLLLDRGLPLNRQAQIGLCQAALPGYAIDFPPMDMMVRILSIAQFVPLIRSQKERTLYVDIEDPILPSNCGCFQITLGPQGSRASRIPRTGSGQKMDIAGLAQVLLADVPVAIREWV